MLVPGMRLVGSEDLEIWVRDVLEILHFGSLITVPEFCKYDLEWAWSGLVYMCFRVDGGSLFVGMYRVLLVSD
jgi:hypothetical protein